MRTTESLLGVLHLQCFFLLWHWRPAAPTSWIVCLKCKMLLILLLVALHKWVYFVSLKNLVDKFLSNMLHSYLKKALKSNNTFSELKQYKNEKINLIYIPCSIHFLFRAWCRHKPWCHIQCSLGFHVYWELSIDVMIFILYKLYILVYFIPNQHKPQWKLDAFLQKYQVLLSLWGHFVPTTYLNHTHDG